MGTWVTDGSDELSVKKNVVKMTPDRLDEIYNAYWREGDGVSSGQHYWKIKFPTLRTGVGRGCTGVGFTSDKHFRAQYSCKSIIYTGDLNVMGLYDKERGCVVEHFGPKLEQGDSVGLLAVFEDKRLKVYIKLNGTPLGLAFDVLASSIEPIFPMVSFDYEGTATCTKKPNLPKKNLAVRYPVVFDGILGPWQLTQHNGQNIPHQLSTTCAFVRKGKDNYVWHVSKFRTELVNKKGVWKSTHIFGSGGVSKKPEKAEKQKKILDLMGAVNKVEIVGNNLSARSDKLSSLWIRPKVSEFIGDDIFASRKPLPSPVTSTSSEGSGSSDRTSGSGDQMPSTSSGSR